MPSEAVQQTKEAVVTGKPPVVQRQYLVLFAILLALFVLYTRVRYHAPFLYSWDSVSFALSTERFDMRLHQPHPPGYILYSYTIRVLNSLTDDANLSMIYLNIAATIGACWLIAKLVHLLTNRKLAAAGAAALYAVHPVSWFYGSVAEVYAVEGFWVALVAYLVIASHDRRHYLLWASAAMAAAGGFRPTTEVFLLPLYATAFFHRRYLLSAAALVVFLLLNLVWFWPLTASVGGVGQYMEALRGQSQRAAEVTAELPAERMSWKKIGVRVMQTITLPALALFLLRIRKMRFTWIEASLFLAILPPLIVFGLLHFPKDGYLLAIIPLLITMAIVLLSRLVSSRILLAAVAVACVISFAGYLWPIPASDSAAEFTRPNRKILETRMDRLQKFFEIVEGLGGGRPRTFVLENRHYFPNWRMLLYYYPQDTVYLIWPNKKRAYLAANHSYRTVVAPLSISSGSMLVMVGRSSPSFSAQAFQIDQFRYHFAEAWNLPANVQVYSIPFVVADAE